MKNKTIMITALLAVMVSMTGMAAADPFNIDINKASPNQNTPADNPTTIPLTGTTVFSLDISSISTAGVGHPYSLTCSISPSAGVTVTCPAGFTPASKTPFVLADVVTVTSSGAPPNTGYLLEVKGQNVTKLVRLDSASANIGLTSIPEFPAVALPVAGVIGLVFFFQHRKSKKEE
ncbi:Uncharacterised protein [uncultured archaeon]|nr:Uncharacterised protein [uncultured archaeon]